MSSNQFSEAWSGIEKGWQNSQLAHAYLLQGAAHGAALRFAEKLLKGKITDEMLDAIVMHNEVATGKERSTKFQHALAAGETITGLITATTLVYPDKKIASVKTSSVSKRMKQKAFAASVKRENILECEKIGIPLDEFVELSIHSMSEISEILGL